VPTPFPGMDPYLEHPVFWPDVHNSLIAEIRNDLAPKLLPRYYIALEERVYLAERQEPTFISRPDVSVLGSASSTPIQTKAIAPAANGLATVEPVLVEVPLLEEIHETFLEVREAKRHVVITVIELLSPVNKRPGLGRNQYEEKRLQVLSSHTHLVEIDLLRLGSTMTISSALQAIHSHYRILISRWQQRPQAVLLPFTVRQPIPSFYLPLPPQDEEPVVDLTALLHTLIERVGYQVRIDYALDPVPPFQGDDALWIDTRLRAAGFR
jgi:hypothetical protein